MPTILSLKSVMDTPNLKMFINEYLLSLIIRCNIVSLLNEVMILGLIF